LAIQFWDIYNICNEKNKHIANVWIDGELRITLRRTFTDTMIQMWEDLLVVVSELRLSEETGTLIWGYNNSETYSSLSLYVGHHKL
jgi:hypothetical protein